MNAPTQKQIAAAIEAQTPPAPIHRNVFTALAAAQTEFSAVIKGASNPAFRSKYADLSAVVEAVAPALSRHGIAFYHMTVPLGDDLAMRTVLHHGESDTQLSCDVPLIVSKRDMQGFKSATTYAKRIGLESVTGVAPEDDDGNAAAKAAPQPAQPPAFNAQAAATRVAKLLSEARDLSELATRWRNEADTLTAIRATDPDQAAHLTAIKDRRKALLSEPTEPTIGEQIGDQIPY